MSRQFYDLIQIINDAGDMLKGGWRTEHPEPVIASVPGQRDSPEKTLEAIASEIRACTACGLHKGRKNAVPGAGVVNPTVMFIGEGPGADEDETGIPFVGKAGQYLDKWLQAIGLERNRNCFIGNIIKCRPPGNRDPLPDEIAACRPFLIRQLEAVRPCIIITLGRFASQVICDSADGIGKLRGRIYRYEGIPVIPTYHPSAVLRDPGLRAPVWEDLKRAKELLNDIEQNR